MTKPCSCPSEVVFNSGCVSARGGECPSVVEVKPLDIKITYGPSSYAEDQVETQWLSEFFQTRHYNKIANTMPFYTAPDPSVCVMDWGRANMIENKPAIRVVFAPAIVELEDGTRITIDEAGQITTHDNWTKK